MENGKQERKKDARVVEFWKYQINPITGLREASRENENQNIQRKQASKWKKNLNIA